MLRIIVKMKRFNKDHSLAEIICCLAIGSSIFYVLLKLVPKLNGTAALTCFTRQARWSSGHKVALEGSWSCPFVSFWSRGKQAKSLKPSEKEHFCRDQSTKQWWLGLRLGLYCNIGCLTCLMSNPSAYPYSRWWHSPQPLSTQGRREIKVRAGVCSDLLPETQELPL